MFSPVRYRAPRTNLWWSPEESNDDNGVADDAEYPDDDEVHGGRDVHLGPIL
jgi:hypothetical protein